MKETKEIGSNTGDYMRMLIKWGVGVVIVMVLFLLYVYIQFFRRPAESLIVNTFTDTPIDAGGVHFLTFGDGIYKEQAKGFADRLGRLPYVTETHFFTGSDIDESFFKNNENILTQKRGFGYWLWKPYFCKRVWDRLNYGDVLVYLDGGLVLTSDLQPFIARAIRSKSGGLAFEQWIRQEDYTKPEVFDVMELPVEIYGRRLQFWAAVFIVQKRESNQSFFEEWLRFCSIPGMIDDSPSKKPSVKPFKHRHDQSIFSLLAWKYAFDVDPAKAFWESFGRPVMRVRPKGYTPFTDGCRS